jgi:hypothetical protein
VRELSGLHPNIRDAAEQAVRWAESQGADVQVTSTYRSNVEQTRLYKNYQDCVRQGFFGTDKSLVPGMTCKYPANPPGLSAHEYGLAWDSWVPPELMPWWAAVRQYFGWEVTPDDPIHAQVPNWRLYVFGQS